MPRFNLDDYEPVAARIEKFYGDHPDGKIQTTLVARENGEWLFKASVYRATDTSPWATGFAHEIDGEGHVNRTAACENAETSAIGRALANAGYATKAERASREEMEKVQRGQSVPAEKPTPQPNWMVRAKNQAVKFAEGQGKDKAEAKRLYESALAGLDLDGVASEDDFNRVLDWLASHAVQTLLDATEMEEG